MADDDLAQFKQEILSMMREYQEELEAFRQRSTRRDCPACGRPFSLLFRTGELKRPSCPHADMIMRAYDDMDPGQYPL